MNITYRQMQKEDSLLGNDLTVYGYIFQQEVEIYDKHFT